MKKISYFLLSTVFLGIAFSFNISVDGATQRHGTSLTAVHDFSTDVPVTNVYVENRGLWYFAVNQTTTNDDGSTSVTQSLWNSNGSSASEVAAFDSGQVLSRFVSCKGKLYFVVTTTATADDGSTTVTDSLYVSDGTSSGTKSVNDFDSTQSVITGITENKGKLYFIVTATTTADDGTVTVTDSLYASDGTSSGTQSINDFDATQTVITDLTASKGKLYFGVLTTITNDDGTVTTTDSLFVSDGSTSTKAFADLDADQYVASDLTEAKGKLYFQTVTLETAEDGTETVSFSLNVTDGKTISLVNDFGSTSYLVTSITENKGSVYFGLETVTTNEDGSMTTSQAIWYSTGTKTAAVQELGTGSTFISGPVSSKGKVFFLGKNTATDDSGATTTVESLWKSDGTSPGTATVQTYESNQTLYNAGTAKGAIFFILDTTTTAEDGTVSDDYQLMKYGF